MITIPLPQISSSVRKSTCKSCKRIIPAKIKKVIIDEGNKREPYKSICLACFASEMGSYMHRANLAIKQWNDINGMITQEMVNESNKKIFEYNVLQRL